MGRGCPGRGGRCWPSGSSSPTDPGHRKRASSLLKKVLGWLLVAFVIFYIIQRPEDAATIVRSAGSALADAATSLAAFVGSLI